MRVMLLSLPGYLEDDRSLFPLGLGYLVGALKQFHRVTAFHFTNMQQACKEIPGKLNAIKPDIIGFTCSTFNRGHVKSMIKQLKLIKKDLIIIVGGVHASYCYEQILNNYSADIVIIGEGEKTIVELCNAIEKEIPLSSVRGISYKENGRIFVSASRDVVKNLDDVPLPDYTYAREFIGNLSMGFIITSRGCPVRCTFCSTSSYWGQATRLHSIERVANEMEILVSQYGVKKIFFHDDTFNIGIERVKTLCEEIIKRGLSVEWACSCRVVPVSGEMIDCMVRAGCRHICWGIESGSEEMLKKINKKITLSQIRNACELSNKFSSVMSTGAFTMVGNPGETKNTVKNSVDFINTLPMTDSPSTSILYVLPGTLLYADLKKSGKIKEQAWAKHSTVPNYTLENSALILEKWARQIRESGRRISFNPKKHFWQQYLEASKTISENKIIFLFKKLKRVIANPSMLITHFNKFLPAGHIRF